MFRMASPNRIESTEGFSVEVLGRVGLRYTEGQRWTKIDSEVLATPGIAVYSESIREWDDGSTIDDEVRSKIIRNIEAALRSQGETLRVI